YMTGRALVIGSKQIYVLARVETKQFFSARPGVALWAMIAPGSLRSRNLQPPFAGHRNSRLNHHSRRPPVSRHYAQCGPILSLTTWRRYSASTMFPQHWPSFSELVRRDSDFQPEWLCLHSSKVMWQIL